MEKSLKRFKAGDIIICIDNNGARALKENETYVVLDCIDDGFTPLRVRLKGITSAIGFFSDRFVLYKPKNRNTNLPKDYIPREYWRK